MPYSVGNPCCMYAVSFRVILEEVLFTFWIILHHHRCCHRYGFISSMAFPTYFSHGHTTKVDTYIMRSRYVRSRWKYGNRKMSTLNVRIVICWSIMRQTVNNTESVYIHTYMHTWKEHKAAKDRIELFRDIYQDARVQITQVNLKDGRHNYLLALCNWH